MNVLQELDILEIKTRFSLIKFTHKFRFFIKKSCFSMIFSNYYLFAPKEYLFLCLQTLFINLVNIEKWMQHCYDELF